jgi:lipopolysaccharide export system protein LptC
LTLNASKLRGIKLSLLITIFLLFGVVLTVFIGYRTVSNPEEMFLSSLIQDDATIAINKVHQTSTKNGIKEWSLDATTAQFMEKEKQAVFDNPSVTLYLENDNSIALSAHKGYLNTDTRDIRIQGDVVADDGEFKILTETLRYEHKRRVLVATTPVQILGSTFRLNAGSALYDMASQTTTFDGQVEGILFENVNL